MINRALIDQMTSWISCWVSVVVSIMVKFTCQYAFPVFVMCVVVRVDFCRLVTVSDVLCDVSRRFVLLHLQMTFLPVSTQTQKTLVCWAHRTCSWRPLMIMGSLLTLVTAGGWNSGLWHLCDWSQCMDDFSSCSKLNSTLPSPPPPLLHSVSYFLPSKEQRRSKNHPLPPPPPPKKSRTTKNKDGWGRGLGVEGDIYYLSVTHSFRFKQTFESMLGTEFLLPSCHIRIHLHCTDAIFPKLKNHLVGKSSMWFHARQGVNLARTANGCESTFSCSVPCPFLSGCCIAWHDAGCPENRLPLLLHDVSPF